MQNQLGRSKIKTLGSIEGYFLFCVGADNQDLLIIIFPGVGVQGRRQLAVFCVVAVLDAGQFLSQGDGFAVEVENGVFILFLRGNIDLFVIFVYIEPGGSGGEAGIFFVAPLDGGTGGVPGAVP